MGTVVELRRAVQVGDQVILRRVNIKPMSNGSVYTVSRINGRQLFGFHSDGTEQFITKDYKTPLSKTFDDGETIVLGVTYLDGTRLL